MTKPTMAQKRFPKIADKTASERRVAEYIDRTKDAIDERDTLTPQESIEALNDLLEYIEGISLPDSQAAADEHKVAHESRYRGGRDYVRATCSCKWTSTWQPGEVTMATNAGERHLIGKK